MTWHVNLGDDTHTTGARVRDDIGDSLGRVPLASGVGVLQHLRVRVDLDGPGLVIGDVPVEDIELGEGESVKLLLDLWNGNKVASGVYHDTAVGVVRVVLDGDRLLDNETIFAVGDDELLECREGMKRAPDRLCGNGHSRRRCLDLECVTLIHIVLQVALPVVNVHSELG